MVLTDICMVTSASGIEGDLAANENWGYYRNVWQMGSSPFRVICHENIAFPQLTKPMLVLGLNGHLHATEMAVTGLVSVTVSLIR